MISLNGHTIWSRTFGIFHGYTPHFLNSLQIWLWHRRKRFPRSIRNQLKILEWVNICIKLANVKCNATKGHNYYFSFGLNNFTTNQGASIFSSIKIKTNLSSNACDHVVIEGKLLCNAVVTNNIIYWQITWTVIEIHTPTHNSPCRIASLKKLLGGFNNYVSTREIACAYFNV